MSVRRQISAAMRKLLEDPKLRIVTEAPEGVFTELDVIFLAARDEHWEDDEARDRWMSMAQREAAEVARFYYNDGQVARFGPVEVPGVEHPDYVRWAAKIIYAPIDGPEILETPNGRFHQMLAENDPIKRTGRRWLAARNDMEPWDGIENATTKDKRDVMRLKAEVAALQARVAELERENDRLRQRAARGSRTRKTA